MSSTKPALLVLVRHGESQMNVAKGHNIYLPEETAMAVKGIPDHKIALTPRGWLQAAQTGVELRRRYGRFDVIYHSGYVRTRQTMQGIIQAYTAEEMAQTKIRQSDLIRERERGYTFNMTTAEAEQNFPFLKEYYECFGPFYTRPPGGQSLCDHCAQVYTFIGLIYRLRAGKKVLVVDHGHTHRSFRYNLEKWTPDQYIESIERGEKSENCAVITYRLNRENNQLELEALNEVFWQEPLAV